eukprot:2876965-Rhodomonas_salina.1
MCIRDSFYAASQLVHTSRGKWSGSLDGRISCDASCDRHVTSPDHDPLMRGAAEKNLSEEL